MGGRSGQSTGGGGGGVNSRIFKYSSEDADVTIEQLGKNNPDYYPSPNKSGLQNWEKFINSYTSNGYKVNEKIVDNKLNENDVKYIKGLNASLDKIPSTEGTFTRGMRLRPGSRTEKLVNSLLNNVGKDIQMNTFLSTSSDKVTSKNFGTGSGTPVLFTVKGKNGKSVEKLSSWATEKEFMFKAGAKFKVNSASKEFDSNYGQEIYKISLTEKR